MAAPQAVEEMRSRVVLGEFGVRNVSLAVWSSGGEMRVEQGRVGIGVGTGLASLPLRGQTLLCSRFIPPTFPVTIPVMMMPGTRTASRRWVESEVSGEGVRIGQCDLSSLCLRSCPWVSLRP